MQRVSFTRAYTQCYTKGMEKFNRTNQPPGFYTYAYLRESDGTPWYIGKGKGPRAWQRHGSDNYRWSPPPNERILFLKWDLSEQNAFKHEVYLIGLYGLERDGGLLAGNQTYGGQGSSGYKQPKKLKELQRQIQTQRQLDSPDPHIVEAAQRWGFTLNDWQGYTLNQRQVIMAGLRRGIDKAAVIAGVELGIDLRKVQSALSLGITNLRQWADLPQLSRDKVVRRVRRGVSIDEALVGVI